MDLFWIPSFLQVVGFFSIFSMVLISWILLAASIRSPLSNDLSLLIFDDLSIMDVSGEIHDQSDDLRLSISPFLRDEGDMYGKTINERE